MMLRPTWRVTCSPHPYRKLFSGRGSIPVWWIHSCFDELSSLDVLQFLSYCALRVSVQFSTQLIVSALLSELVSFWSLKHTVVLSVFEVYLCFYGGGVYKLHSIPPPPTTHTHIHTTYSICFSWLERVVVLCFFRLAETKSSVMKALAEDFDTPQAIFAIMNLVYHGNCQLHPVSKVHIWLSCDCINRLNSSYFFLVYKWDLSVG